jgi:hypothetical protein
MGTNQFLRDFRIACKLKKFAELCKKVQHKKEKQQEKAESVPFLVRYLNCANALFNVISIPMFQTIYAILLFKRQIYRKIHLPLGSCTFIMQSAQRYLYKNRGIKVQEKGDKIHFKSRFYHQRSIYNKTTST